ncbi:hypothetical protein Dimus_029631 [Dionaea muscipula]
MEVVINEEQAHSTIKDLDFRMRFSGIVDSLKKVMKIRFSILQTKWCPAPGCDHAEVTEKVRKMAADRQVTFKMYKRRGERDLKEKAKANKDGRKRRAHRRQWGLGRSRADI